jgi:hypothetical protein
MLTRYVLKKFKSSLKRFFFLWIAILFDLALLLLVVLLLTSGVFLILSKFGEVFAKCHISDTGLFKPSSVYCPTNKGIEHLIEGFSVLINPVLILIVVLIAFFPRTIPAAIFLSFILAFSFSLTPKA